ncbi:MAG: phosphoribosylformylglycinamidine synthase, partial [Candidatus Brocadiae bacterium]|nr:phosphoribosylformylglycinamidine synthase [Candidatus Brocadiia bacterium]
AAEMALAGGLGCEIDLDVLPAPADLPVDARLFAESCTRFLVEVEPGQEAAFADAMKPHPAARVGRVGGGVVRFLTAGRAAAEIGVAEAHRAWSAPLAW